MVFKNEAQLKNFLLAKCKAAIVQAEEKVHRIIDDCLRQFYSEFSPDEYIRTQQLLHSLVRSGVKQIGNGFEAEVYFDVGALNYQTGAIWTQHGSGYATWDAETVLRVAMTGDYGGLPHGGYEGGTAIWTESMNRLGNVFELLKRELIMQGVPIKKG
jgi:hypothetical protein